jgi:hypothetical protein
MRRSQPATPSIARRLQRTKEHRSTAARTNTPIYSRSKGRENVRPPLSSLGVLGVMPKSVFEETLRERPLEIIARRSPLGISVRVFLTTT